MTGTQVVERVHRLGTELVNWYLVEDDDGVTVVDAGLPKYWPQLGEALGALGRGMDDVRALILTHGDSDHFGAAERIRTEGGTTVHVHDIDHELITEGKRKKPENKNLLPYFRHSTARRLIVHFARNGGLKPPRVGAAERFGDGAVLDVPGRPRVIHTPGHTNGHVAFHFERHGALFVGDLLCELNPLTGRRGSQIPPSPFNVSSDQMLDSLAKIEGLDAEAVLFGHGEPWTKGPREAVARAREAGRS